MTAKSKTINCDKLVLESGCYRCRQSDESPCGCWTHISYPTVDAILSSEQLKNRKVYLEKIKESIKERNAALVLGAGVSVPSNMPTWGKLISQMMGYAIQYEHTNKSFVETVDEGQHQRTMQLTTAMINAKLELLTNVNALESAEYVAQYFDLGDTNLDISDKLPEASMKAMVYRMINESFTPEELLRKCCADTDAEKYLVAEDDDSFREIAKLSTIFAVSYLMSTPKGVRKAMTYNYDPLVQEHMMSLYKVDSNNILSHPGKWNLSKSDSNKAVREIFHVHGYVPGQRHLDKKLKRVYPDSSGPLVLSEDSYYRIEQEEAYNWSSSIQSFFLNKYNCIFVGFSAEDYNFRRILRQIGNHNSDIRRDHYLVLTVDDWIRKTYEDVCTYHVSKMHRAVAAGEAINPKMIEDIHNDTVLLLQHILQCRERYWKRFRIYPIWVTIGEIPSVLTSLIK